jgi:[protein-PII] uridylyltransferase
MQRYYRTSKSVVLLNAILLRLIGRPPAWPPGHRREQTDRRGFAIRDGLLDVRDSQVFERHPAAILRAFLELAQRPEVRGFSAPMPLRELLAPHAVRSTPPSGRDPRNIETFNALLRQSRGLTRSLQRMNRWRHPRPLPAGVRPHRRPDAARPVPRLHGRRAHPDGVAQRQRRFAHGRVRPRVPAVLAG